MRSQGWPVRCCLLRTSPVDTFEEVRPSRCLIHFQRRAVRGLLLAGLVVLSCGRLGYDECGSDRCANVDGGAAPAGAAGSAASQQGGSGSVAPGGAGAFGGSAGTGGDAGAAGAAGAASECALDGDCDDGQFCTGVESCSDGACVAGQNPCAASLQVCDDQADECVGGPLNINLGVLGSLSSGFGPAYAAFGGTAAMPDGFDQWNGVDRHPFGDEPGDVIVYADGRTANGLKMDPSREQAYLAEFVSWSYTDMIEESGDAPEGIQVGSADAWASPVVRSYVRENGGLDTIRAFALSIEGLPPGSYDVYVVADRPQVTGGENSGYVVRVGADDAADDQTDYSQFPSQVVTNADWSRWEEGVTYARLRAELAQDQDIIVISREADDLDDLSLINFVQVVPLP